MIDVNFEYYHTTYKGSLDEQTFDKFVTRSYMTIDSYCFGRFETANSNDFSEFQLSKIKYCVCAVTDKLFALTGADGTYSAGVTESESVGPWTVKYSTKSLPTSVQASLKELIFSYLSTTNLMVAWC